MKQANRGLNFASTRPLVGVETGVGDIGERATSSLGTKVGNCRPGPVHHGQSNRLSMASRCHVWSER